MIEESKYKARWLGWWNSNDMSRESYCFALGDVKETKFGNWVVKVLFWA